MSEEPQVWCILELMGHVRLAGRLTEEEKFGTKMGRLDIPQEDGSFVSQWFGGSSVYRITIVTERVARDVAKRNQPAPVSPWDYPKELTHKVEAGVGRIDDDMDDEEADY